MIGKLPLKDLWKTSLIVQKTKSSGNQNESLLKDVTVSLKSNNMEWKLAAMPVQLDWTDRPGLDVALQA